MTAILELEKMKPADWDQLSLSLLDGALACLPTDTTYGLTAMPKPETVEKIYAVKCRPAEKPLPLLFRHAIDIAELLGDLNPEIQAALERIMPGPVTAIIPLEHDLPQIAVHQRGSLGVRIVPPPIGDLYARLPSPLAMTSANLSGRSDPCAAYEISEEVIEACDFVIDAGRTTHCLPSTVVDLRPMAAGRPARVLREGPLGEEELMQRLAS